MPQPQHAIFFELSDDGVEGAEQHLANIKKGLTTSRTASAAPTATTAASPAVILHQAMEANRSREFLEALSTKPQTFDELSPHLSANHDGTALSAAQVRAVYRNIRRREEGLISSGKIDRQVVRANFDLYEQEHAGRYSLTTQDLDALDQLLGR